MDADFELDTCSVFVCLFIYFWLVILVQWMQKNCRRHLLYSLSTVVVTCVVMHVVTCDIVHLTLLPFLPARRYASAGLCDSDVSVRLFVTRRYCA